MTENERLLDLALADAADEIRRLEAENRHLRELTEWQESRLQSIGRMAQLALQPTTAGAGKAQESTTMAGRSAPGTVLMRRTTREEKIDRPGVYEVPVERDA